MQKTILQIIQQVATELNLPQPTAVVSSQDQNVLKLLGIARAVCDDLLAEHDWQCLQMLHTFSTSDGVQSYAFPVDIARFIEFTIFDSTSRWPVQGSLTPGQWEWLKTGFVSSPPYSRYRIWQDEIFLDPTPGPTAHTLSLEYISNYFVRDGSTGAGKPDFTQDDDICVFDHRVMVYGVKLKFLASISQDTTAALVDYARALMFAKGHDIPAQRLSLVTGSDTRLLSTENYTDGSWTGA